MRKCNTIISVLLIACLLLSLTGCQKENVKTPGTGKKGVIDKIDWMPYDRLIEQIKAEADIDKRIDLMHKAEDMLMDTGAVIPLLTRTSTYMCHKNIQNAGYSNDGIPLFNYAKSTDGRSKMSICVGYEPMSLDPIFATASDTIAITTNAYGKLFQTTLAGGTEPELAKSYTVSKDYKTYIFTIRDDAKWSDGKDVTAEDFVYSWKRAADVKTAADYGFIFSIIDGYPNNLNVKATDKKTLVVKLNNPCTYFLNLVSFSPYAPVRKDAIEGAKGYKDKDGNVANHKAWGMEAGKLSCGAYTVDEWAHKEKLILKKNPYYCKRDKVNMKQINFMLSQDLTAIYLGYSTKALDYIVSVPADQIDKVKKSGEYHEMLMQGMDYLSINVKDEIFSGFTKEEAKTFRKALSYAIDREFLLKVVTNKEKGVSDSLIAAGFIDMNGRDFKQNTATYHYPVGTGYYETKQDVDKAREMLKSIGFEFDKDGKVIQEIEMDYNYNTNETNTNLATCLQSDFAELGIKLTLNSMDWNVFLAEKRMGKSTARRGTWMPDYLDPVAMLEIFSSDSEQNDTMLGK